MTIHLASTMVDGLDAIIDVSSLTSDAASVIGDTGEPVTDTWNMTADAERGVNDSRSIAYVQDTTVGWTSPSRLETVGGC